MHTQQNTPTHKHTKTQCSLLKPEPTCDSTSRPQNHTVKLLFVVCLEKSFGFISDFRLFGLFLTWTLRLNETVWTSASEFCYEQRINKTEGSSPSEASTNQRVWIVRFVSLQSLFIYSPCDIITIIITPMRGRTGESYLQTEPRWRVWGRKGTSPSRSASLQPSPACLPDQSQTHTSVTANNRHASTTASPQQVTRERQLGGAAAGAD